MGVGPTQILTRTKVVLGWLRFDDHSMNFTYPHGVHPWNLLAPLVGYILGQVKSLVFSGQTLPGTSSALAVENLGNSFDAGEFPKVASLPLQFT